MSAVWGCSRVPTDGCARAACAPTHSLGVGEPPLPRGLYLDRRRVPQARAQSFHRAQGARAQTTVVVAGTTEGPVGESAWYLGTGWDRTATPRVNTGGIQHTRWLRGSSVRVRTEEGRCGLVAARTLGARSVVSRAEGHLGRGESAEATSLRAVIVPGQAAGGDFCCLTFGAWVLLDPPRIPEDCPSCDRRQDAGVLFARQS
jgi:hypothetical protein